MTAEKIVVEWYDAEKTMIVFTFYEGWTVEAFKRSYQQALEMTATVTHLVGYICDLSDSPSFPVRIFEAAYYTERNVLPNLYMTVLVNPPRIAHVIIGTLRRVKLTIIDHITLADSVEAAAAILRTDAEKAQPLMEGTGQS